MACARLGYPMLLRSMTVVIALIGTQMFHRQRSGVTSIDREVEVHRRPYEASRGLRIQESAHSLLRFEPNLGQANGEAEFVARMSEGAVALTCRGATFVLLDSRPFSKASRDWTPLSREPEQAMSLTTVGMETAGARQDIEATGVGALPGKSNYLIGGEPARWQRNIPHYREVLCRDVYPGIDLVFYGNGRELEYDFRVHPGAHPEQVRIDFRGVDKLHVDEAGDLILTVRGAEVKQRRPRIYQEKDGQPKDVGGAYVVLGGESGGVRAAPL